MYSTSSNFCYVHFLVFMNDWAQNSNSAELFLIICQNFMTKKINEDLTLFKSLGIILY